MIRNHLSYTNVAHMQIIDTYVSEHLRRARAAFRRERAILSWRTSEEKEAHQTLHALLQLPDTLKMSTTHIITFPALLMLLYCKCMMIACLIIWRSLVYVVCVLDILKEKFNFLTLNEMVWGFWGVSWNSSKLSRIILFHFILF